MRSSGSVIKFRTIWTTSWVGIENSAITFVRTLMNYSSSDSARFRSAIRSSLRFRTATKSLVWPWNARPEFPLVASSNGTPAGCAICHAAASASLSQTPGGTSGLAILCDVCLFSIGWRPCVNEKQTTFKEEKTIWQINQYLHAG